MHYWVERKFKIDDAVGAVAVHGYAGVAGLIICGFVLNGYPSSGYSVGAMWDGSTYASINPLGQFLRSNYNVRSSWNVTRLCFG
jgi:Amt family ammonium transporter